MSSAATSRACRRSGGGMPVFSAVPGDQQYKPRPQAATRALHLAVNRQLLEAATCLGLQQFLKTVVAHLPQMNIVNLCTSLHRLAKFSCDTHEVHKDAKHSREDGEAISRTAGLVLTSLGNRLDADCGSKRSNGVSAQGLSNIMWSLATLGIFDHQILQQVSRLTLKMLHEFKFFELASLVWAAAKLRACETMMPLFPTVAEHVSEMLTVSSSTGLAFRSLSTLAWAYAKANEMHHPLFEKLAAHMSHLAADANCQELANAAWAFATMKFPEMDLMRTIQVCALHRSGEFKAQEISNLLWALGTFGLCDGYFLQTFIDKASCLDLGPQHLANILWACCQRPHDHFARDAVTRLLPLCTFSFHAFRPQEAVIVCQSISMALKNQSLEMPFRKSVDKFLASLTVSLLQRKPPVSDRYLEQIYKAAADVGYEATVHPLHKAILRRSKQVPRVRPVGGVDTVRQPSAHGNAASIALTMSRDATADANESKRAGLEACVGSGPPMPQHVWIVKNTFLELVIPVAEGGARVRRSSAPAQLKGISPAVALMTTGGDPIEDFVTGSVDGVRFGSNIPADGEGLTFLKDKLSSGDDDDETDTVKSLDTTDRASTDDDSPLPRTSSQASSTAFEAV